MPALGEAYLLGEFLWPLELLSHGVGSQRFPCWARRGGVVLPVLLG